MVAGELSGDLLGAGLIAALRRHWPNATFEGIGGPRMIEQGFDSHYPMELLSVMGLFEVLGRYRQIKRVHAELTQYFLQNPPDVFIGIDAPDFTLPLEQRLHPAGIKTAHYVSPSVWAWRKYRLAGIQRGCDLMLTLFPFEAAYYQEKNIPVRFVGHPLASKIPLQADPAAARRHLGLDAGATYLAMLPGSRGSEVSRLSLPFLQAAAWLHERRPGLRWLVAIASPTVSEIFQRHAANFPQLDLALIQGQSQAVMAAADAVLLASGTATLEAMLLKRPMVAAYRFAPLTYWIGRFLVHTRFFSLPNLLAQEKLVPEFLQGQASPQNLGAALLEWLEQPEKVRQAQARFAEIHQQLGQNADSHAAAAVVELVERRLRLPL
jgi:lipid-A-disaccharide synthase